MFTPLHKTLCTALVLSLLLLWGLLISGVAADAQPTPIEQLVSAVPETAAEHNSQTTNVIRSLVPQVENWIVEKTTFDQGSTNDELLEGVRYVLNLDGRVSNMLDGLYKQRAEFINIENEPDRYRAARGFLGCATELIKLSGRIRYYSVDLLSGVGYDLEQMPEDYEALLNLYLDEESSVGAITSLELLLETLRDPTSLQISDHIKGKILQLTRLTREIQLLPLLAEMTREKSLDPELLIFVADTIRHIGLPQTPRPDAAADLAPPSITGEELFATLSDINDRDLGLADKKRLQDLLDWLTERERLGIQGEEFRFGTAVVRDGDWLLMKNPSPYNRFTDLYPGLFTHAGVVTTETAGDGRRRFVVVDLPEVGNAISAIPVEKFVERTLDYVILRHQDPQTLKTMGRVANSVIGNDSKFDLNFRTSEIEKLKGQSLDNKLIEGYCAGLLLLCAQETGKSLQEFFPLEEHPAGGNTLSNLAQLDISMPNHFLSPTGPIFSSRAIMVHRCHTMYSPRRQIEQTIYDHFAEQMRNGRLKPSLNWFESMRLNLAEAAEKTPALSRALANAAGVNQNIDLVAAAKLGAVVQSLDVIARGASREYQQVRNAFQLDAIEELENGPAGDKQFAQIVRRRRKHADLFVRWEAGALTPRELRTELVDHYIQRGCRQLDNRFFQNIDEAVSNPPIKQTGR